ncbi:MAG TPA: esterase [Flavobacteriaceae bacterium]|nr:esterase [Flavobacteriaceae bacterium]|tara:strand:+ start:150 stop:791 length:642 start_codon:yes stop_codon:yes gene_type:complete
MNQKEKEIKYTLSNTYSTLNLLTSKTKNVWFVCHGIGHLSRYFIRHFNELDSDENYIIAPQAQSKFYIAPKMKHIGACWLTKENTKKETNNVINYFNEIFANENIPSSCNLILLGFSQGVSVITRFIAKSGIKFNKLIVYAGKIPTELSKNDFKHIDNKSKVYLVYCANDLYIDEKTVNLEKKKAKNLFNNISTINFDIAHEINASIVNQLPV